MILSSKRIKNINPVFKNNVKELNFYIVKNIPSYIELQGRSYLKFVGQRNFLHIDTRNISRSGLYCLIKNDEPWVLFITPFQINEFHQKETLNTIGGQSAIYLFTEKPKEKQTIGDFFERLIGLGESSLTSLLNLIIGGKLNVETIEDFLVNTEFFESTIGSFYTVSHKRDEVVTFDGLFADFTEVSWRLDKISKRRSSVWSSVSCGDERTTLITARSSSGPRGLMIGGLCSFGFTIINGGKYCKIITLFTQPDYRRLGVATRLMERLIIETIIPKRYNGCTLIIKKDCYEGLGFLKSLTEGENKLFKHVVFDKKREDVFTAYLMF